MTDCTFPSLVVFRSSVREQQSSSPSDSTPVTTGLFFQLWPPLPPPALLFFEPWRKTNFFFFLNARWVGTDFSPETLKWTWITLRGNPRVETTQEWPRELCIERERETLCHRISLRFLYFPVKKILMSTIKKHFFQRLLSLHKHLKHFSVSGLKERLFLSLSWSALNYRQ